MNTNTNNQRKYFYTVKLEDIKNGFGNPIPPTKEITMAFTATPDEAQSVFFNKGYMLDSEEGIFDDNGLKFISESFETTNGHNSYENYVPDRIKIIMEENPLLRVYPDATFGSLLVQRYTAPSGGKRKIYKRTTHKRTTRKRTTRKRTTRKRTTHKRTTHK